MALSDLGSFEVEELELARRSIERIGSRDFGLIVLDVHAGDPVALLGDLARRLAGASRRGVPVVAVHDEASTQLPAIESLITRQSGRRLTRPFEPEALLALIGDFGGAAVPGPLARAAS